MLTVAASRVIGPAFDEERRITVAYHATDVARAVTRLGPRALGAPSTKAIFEELIPFGVLPGLLSGWLGEVFASAGMIDRLTGARIGWLLWTGLAPAAVYLMVEPSRGRRTAAISACALFAMPRFVYAAATAREPAVVTSIWLVVIALYLRAIPPSSEERRRGVERRFRLFAPLCAMVLGLGIATDLAVIGVIPLIAVHYFLTRGVATWRSWRRGLTPVPSAFLWAVLITPIVLLAAAPALWRGASSDAEWLLGPLAPTIEPVLYHGGPVASVRDVPWSYSVNWLAATLPIGILALAIGGGGILLAERIAVTRGAARRDATHFGWLALLVIAGVTLGPIVTPAVLTRFPPRVELALPFIACLAAIALDGMATRLVGLKRSAWIAGPVCLGLLAFGLSGLPTSSASFGLLGGGTRGAVASRFWAVGDGSELAALAPSIDALGPRVYIESRDVPRSYWSLLNAAGRMRAHVEGGRRGEPAVVVARGARDHAMATVARDGAVLWSLNRR